jgi:RNA polymerase sigma-70 factor, ECF subfamily
MRTVDLRRTPEAAGTDAAAAVLALFEQHGTSIYRFCRFTLRHEDDADDVLQETFLKLLQHLQRGGDRTNLRAWLFTVAANACRDRMRSRFRWLPWSAELDDRVAPDTAEQPDYHLADVAMRSLAPRDRLLLSLRAQGLSYREIAAAAGIRETSVGRLLARAVDHWKRAIDARNR